LSLANVQISLETEAKALHVEKNKTMAGIITRKVVAGFEFVAS